MNLLTCEWNAIKNKAVYNKYIRTFSFKGYWVAAIVSIKSESADFNFWMNLIHFMPMPLEKALAWFVSPTPTPSNAEWVLQSV